MDPGISPRTKVPTPQSEKGLFREEDTLQGDHSKNKGGLLGGISPKQPLVFSPITIIALPLTLTLTDLLALSSDSSSNTAPILQVISADPIADDLIFHFTIQLQSSPFIHHIFLSASEPITILLHSVHWRSPITTRHPSSPLPSPGVTPTPKEERFSPSLDLSTPSHSPTPPTPLAPISKSCMWECGLEGSSSLSPLPSLPRSSASPAGSSLGTAPHLPTITAYTRNSSPSSVLLAPSATTSPTGSPASADPTSSPGDGLQSTYLARLGLLPSGYEWAAIPNIPATRILRETIAFYAFDKKVLPYNELKPLLAHIPDPSCLSYGDAYNDYRRLRTAFEELLTTDHAGRILPQNCANRPRLPSSEPGPSSRGFLL
ncbi:hypothetical protein BOTBODRAFT_180796 [Botryobasidium botryosum FD-172 SS1]|uniref:Uncharacterized protein n=1 Tax=Botryobasidium botryosum (strain FD-172 SS1) TaxID=930990 RepID=A0A067M6A6_BOTB1|nr:hypothetical protein BOTBODRAFT_180796 [Botryobasidium botryosum FD-172 SS1]